MGSERGPSFEGGSSASTPQLKKNTDKKHPGSSIPVPVACLHDDLVQPRARRRKLTEIRCCSLHLGCDLLSPWTHSVLGLPEAVMQEQYLPSAATAIQNWHRAPRSSDEKHH